MGNDVRKRATGEALEQVPQRPVSEPVRRETGEVVRLDRGYPLVRLGAVAGGAASAASEGTAARSGAGAGELVRCEHATELVKEGDQRAVIGDVVEVSWPDGHDKAIISAILPRRNKLVRKDPTERALPQVLAANFDLVMVAQPLAEVNVRRLERELVLAHETGAQVVVVLTKADLAGGEQAIEDVRSRVRAIAGAQVPTLVLSAQDPASVEAVRELLAPGTTTVLVGKSGVGKSSLVNLLVGHEVQQTAHVREGDGKGRHTTVSREIIDVPGGGRVVDMPGVRGLGLWDADAGIGAAFADVEEVAERCRFRDCRHGDEPGCAVRAAMEAGELAAERVESYLALKSETAEVRQRREQARRLRGEKASDKKRSKKRKR